MKKLFLTSALVIAACSAAQAVEAPSLGDRIKQNWDTNNDRMMWNDPVKHDPAFPGAADDRVKERDNNDNGPGVRDDQRPGHKHMHHMTKEERAAKKAEWSKMTPEQKAAKKSEMKAEHHEKMAKMTPEEKAKMKADRKAKWDAMTPEQKAAWKAKHSAKKAAVTTSTPAAATK